MNLEEQLNNARMKLELIEEGRVSKLQEFQEEIKVREQRQERHDTLADFKDWVSRYEVNSAKDIEDRKKEIAALEERIASPDYQLQKRTRAALENMKETARAAWLQEGGTKEDFEDVWPEMKKDILKKRTFAALEKAIGEEIT